MPRLHELLGQLPFLGFDFVKLPPIAVQLLRLPAHRFVRCGELAAGLLELLVRGRECVAQLISPVGGNDRRLKPLSRFRFEPRDPLGRDRQTRF